MVSSGFWFHRRNDFFINMNCVAIWKFLSLYEKVKTSFKDKEGNEIPGNPSEDGEQPKKDIPGYRFVETKKLPNGDTVHVYEKIIPSVKPEPAKPSKPAPAKPAKELPNTGTEDHSSLAALGLLGVLSGFGLVARKKKKTNVLIIKD